MLGLLIYFTLLRPAERLAPQHDAVLAQAEHAVTPLTRQIDLTQRLTERFGYFSFLERKGVALTSVAEGQGFVFK